MATSSQEKCERASFNQPEEIANVPITSGGLEQRLLSYKSQDEKNAGNIRQNPLQEGNKTFDWVVHMRNLLRIKIR